MKDLMVDIETMGNTSNAAIIQIGACYFDRYTGEIGDKFICNISLEDELNHGFEVTASTIQWWMNQSDEARYSVFSAYQSNSSKAGLGAFSEFVKPSTQVWSHATFDFVIIANHFRDLKISYNMPFWCARDMRTIMELAGKRNSMYKREGIHHNGLDDAIFQAKVVADCMKTLGKK